MSCKCLGLLSDWEKNLIKFLSSRSYMISELFKFSCAVINCRYILQIDYAYWPVHLWKPRYKWCIRVILLSVLVLVICVFKLQDRSFDKSYFEQFLWKREKNPWYICNTVCCVIAYTDDRTKLVLTEINKDRVFCLYFYIDEE